MLFALGAASTAIDALKALTSSKSSSSTSTKTGQATTGLFDVSGTAAPVSPGASNGSPNSGGSQISPDTMSALLDAQSQSSSTATSSSTGASNALKDLFSQIDANGDGQITKSEFENALGAGGTNLANADSVFSKLDKNGNGSVSLDELASALKGGGKGGHHHAHKASGGAGTDGSSSDPLLQALDGASSTSSINSDGSTTTTLSYADGSKVTMTSAVPSSASGAATSSYNFVEQMIQRQSQAIAAQASSQLSVSV